MKIIKLFLASSEELAQERAIMADVVGNLNASLYKRIMSQKVCLSR